MASAAWQRRNARARALGYQSYFDFRVHDFGRIPASGAPLTGEARAQAAGKRGLSNLRRTLRSGKVSLVFALPFERNADGQFTRLAIVVTLAKGKQRRYDMKMPNKPDLFAIGKIIEDEGIILETNYPELFGLSPNP